MRQGTKFALINYLTMQEWQIDWSDVFNGYVARNSLMEVLTKDDLEDILKDIQIGYIKRKIEELLELIRIKEGGN